MQLTILLCKSAGLHKGDLSVRLQVSLVSHHHYDDIGAGQSPGVRQPVCQCIVCLTAGEEMEKQARRERSGEREYSEESPTVFRYSTSFIMQISNALTQAHPTDINTVDHHFCQPW